MSANIKICITTPEFPPDQWGGLARTAERVARCGAESGLEVHVAVFRVADGPLVLLDENRVDSARDGLIIHRITLGRERAGETRELWDCPHNLTLQMMYQSLEMLHRDVGFELFHSFFLYPVGYVTGLLAKRFRARSVTTIVGNDVKKYPFSPEKAALCSSGLENADLVVALSGELLDMADALSPIREKARVVYNSVEIPAEGWSPKRDAGTERLGAATNNRGHLPRLARVPMAGTVGSTHVQTAHGHRGSTAIDPFAQADSDDKSSRRVKNLNDSSTDSRSLSTAMPAHAVPTSPSAPEGSRRTLPSESLESSPSDTSRDDESAPAEPSFAPFRIGCAGIFKYAKGLPYLFKAVAGLSERFPLVLELRGTLRDSERDVYRQMVTRTGIEKHLRLLEPLSHDDIPRWLRSLDLFVLPSVSEGCPNILMEAMASGVPCVATKTGAVEDLMLDGVSGLSVPWGESAALAAAMERVIQDPGLAMSLGTAARQRMRLFSSQREQRAWKSVYAQLEALLHDR
ncbi:MAG: glycosyltransferase [Thermodesulfobacteriota bacterium]